jgi:biopolymer transport protein TolR
MMVSDLIRRGSKTSALVRHKLVRVVSKKPDEKACAAAANAGWLRLRVRRLIRQGVLTMGMSAGGSKGGPVSDPNIVPLIDMLLVLIIIFMVITPKVPTGLPTLVPRPAPPEPRFEPPDPYTIVVQVMQSGKIMINQDQSDWNTLGARLSDIFKGRAVKLAFVEGAEDAPFAEVARAIDIMRGSGIEQVGLITAGDNIRRKAL